ncbi:hypothetical protein CALVIDRAFT_247397 [Calocera viscosa TUFC12733]|uniref:Uncharacterized protein n=1 Tax=Calocera viscosa (strain TUFC12733) TaxID=1330018 RepID=A0A167JKR3_CALVF|nr:hypothetical protein CALVIDRAFT_247397 [Calocera viscosa TUFC12733]
MRRSFGCRTISTLLRPETPDETPHAAADFAPRGPLHYDQLIRCFPSKQQFPSKRSLSGQDDTAFTICRQLGFIIHHRLMAYLSGYIVHLLLDGTQPVCGSEPSDSVDQLRPSAPGMRSHSCSCTEDGCAREASQSLRVSGRQPPGPQTIGGMSQRLTTPTLIAAGALVLSWCPVLSVVSPDLGRLQIFLTRAVARNAGGLRTCLASGTLRGLQERAAPSYLV